MMFLWYLTIFGNQIWTGGKLSLLLHDNIPRIQQQTVFENKTNPVFFNFLCLKSSTDAQVSEEISPCFRLHSQQNFIFLPFVMRMMTSMIMACVLFCLSINTPSLALFAVSLSVRLSYSQVKRRLPNVWMVRVVSLTNPVQISSLHHQQTRQMFVFGIRQDSLALVPSLRLNSTKIVSDKPLVNLADALRPPRQIHLSVTQKRNFFLIL